MIMENSILEIESCSEINVKTKKPYYGKQGESLNSQRIINGYISNNWGTYLCWKSLNRKINKGEKGIRCFYPTRIKIGVDKEGNDKFKKVRNYFIVFNENQTSPMKKRVVGKKNLGKNKVVVKGNK
jgi:antirestriction protein ArdC